MIPIEDGFGEDMPVSKNGPPDFSNLYVRTHFPETWLWVDTETRYYKQKETNCTCQVFFYFFIYFYYFYFVGFSSILYQRRKTLLKNVDLCSATT